MADESDDSSSMGKYWPEAEQQKSHRGSMKTRRTRRQSGSTKHNRETIKAEDNDDHDDDDDDERRQQQQDQEQEGGGNHKQHRKRRRIQNAPKVVVVRRSNSRRHKQHGSSVAINQAQSVSELPSKGVSSPSRSSRPRTAQQHRSMMPLDWDALAASARCAVEHNLHKSMDTETCEHLLGLATTFSRDGDALWNDPMHNNPLHGLPSAPLPPGILDSLVQRFRQQYAACPQFDASGLVTIGMMVEESITASLLPLAQLHCARMRQLQSSAPRRSQLEATEVSVLGDDCLTLSVTANANDDTQKQVFAQQTLPPEEAVLQVLAAQSTSEPHEGNSVSALPPIREVIKDTPVSQHQLSQWKEK